MYGIHRETSDNADVTTLYQDDKDPIKVKSYLMPYAMREIIKEEVVAMLEADIIELSKSAFTSCDS